MLQNSLNTLLDRQVDSSDGAVKLNDDVIRLFHDIASSVTSIRSGKQTNKKKWFDKQCRQAKTEANRADRSAEKYPHTIPQKKAISNFEKLKERKVLA